jgi:hypothetical protein
MWATLERARKAKEMIQGNYTSSASDVSTEGDKTPEDLTDRSSTQDAPQDNATRAQLDRTKKAKEMLQRNYTSSATDLSKEDGKPPTI